MKASSSRSLLMATTVLALPALTAPALAAEHKPAASALDGAGIEEVVVTAQRRAQDILSVPASISATSGTQLAEAGIRTLGSLQFTTPGFLPTDVAGSVQIFIRGVGNSVYTADPSVATFVDDVPRIWGTMAGNLVDVQRIEVMKGAQGGLYGRNATGGVVNIITRQPSDVFEGNAQFSYGEKDTLQAAGYINVPLSDNVAWNFSFDRESHAPYVKNISTNPTPYTAAMFPTGSYLGTPQQTADFFNSAVHPLSGIGEQNFWAADSKLLVRIGNNFKITFAADFSDKRDNNTNQFYQTQPEASRIFVMGLFNAFGINAQLPPGFMPGHSGDFTTSRGVNPIFYLRDYGGSATAVLNLADVDITSISAYRGQRGESLVDPGAEPAASLYVAGRTVHWFFYQELRAVSTGEGPFHYIAGATYLSDHLDGDTKAYILPPLYNTDTHVKDAIENWSVYAQGAYDFTPELTLTVSGRYVHETNTASFIVPVANGISTAESKFLPSANLSYRFEGGGNAYIRWARGFKAGGVNPSVPPQDFPTDFGKVISGEQVDTYEIGYRAPLLDRRMQLTTALFYNDDSNLQVNAHGAPSHPEITNAIVNAGSARTWGAEASLDWRIIDPLTVGVSAGYLNAKYRKFSIPAGTVLQPFDLSGTTMLNSPTWQLAFTGQLDQPLNDELDLIGTVMSSYISKSIYAQSGLPGFLPDATQPGYWLTNLRLGVRTADDKYEFAVSANNLFNEAYTTGGSSASVTANVLEWGTPRIVRAEFLINF